MTGSWVYPLDEAVLFNVSSALRAPNEESIGFIGELSINVFVLTFTLLLHMLVIALIEYSLKAKDHEILASSFEASGSTPSTRVVKSASLVEVTTHAATREVRK